VVRQAIVRVGENKNVPRFFRFVIVSHLVLRIPNHRLKERKVRHNSGPGQRPG
jgi:hypothetical protein